jgi:heme/copper-type cytochrome/quinol oxidase subunit 2
MKLISLPAHILLVIFIFIVIVGIIILLLTGVISIYAKKQTDQEGGIKSKEEDKLEDKIRDSNDSDEEE